MAGVVAAGHAKTAEAGKIILEAGGNAFDAAVAAALASCVTEPTLASLGGGGFLLAHTTEGKNKLLDFFTQTPSARPSHIQPDLFPIEADFGDTTQEFHIGLASMAVPGMMAGLVVSNRDLGRLPFSVVAEPAIAYAREGIAVSDFQGYCYELLEPILLNTAGARSIYAPYGKLLVAGQQVRMPEFADTLEFLANNRHSGGLRKYLWDFYEGEIAQSIVQSCQEAGGYLTMADFQNYRVIERTPLEVTYRGTQMITNPPPSAGGSLIAFCLELLDRFEVGEMDFGSAEHLSLLSQAMRWTNVARRSHLDTALFDPAIAQKFTSPELVEKYVEPIEQLINQGLNRWGSTTHISVIDDEGNAASITSSNGEGSSYVIPDTQIMMNNMLGEEDLNPHGFNQWPLNQRLSSMMAPTMILKGGKPQLVLGSGGSNRIRSAILQVISNILDFKMPLTAAVEAPRIHWEGGTFHLEPGLIKPELTAELSANKALKEALGTDKIVQWQQSNMFFGGVHTTAKKDKTLQGAGDSR
ncbi:MAG: gamma-glutamyltransferase, partial [Cyanobacteria bacterium J06650_10]